MPTITDANKEKGYYYINYLLIFVLSILIIVIFSFMVNYYITYCEQKKTFYNYLMDMNFYEPCEETREERRDEAVSSYLSSTETTAPSAKPRPVGSRLATAGRILTRRREVFNMGDQIYTYSQAQEKCATYNADLASYEQIVDAYNNGANWCTYGWSKGGNAYYPTQAYTWQELQRLPPRFRNACGRVGINGGKFPRRLKLGANCYGIKPVGAMPLVPKPIIPELSLLQVPPESKAELPFCDKKKNFNSCNKLKDDRIKPFNNETWSRY